MGDNSEMHLCAGGVVLRENPEGEPDVLLIKVKRGDGRIEWLLPKGHIENDETEEDAAKREIKEETGIESCELKSHGEIGYISYSFTTDLSEQAEKTVRFFLFSLPESSAPLEMNERQLEEGIVKADFFSKGKAGMLLSFEAYRKLAERGFSEFERRSG
ncbi:NUDIX domain-containing protein [bacterium]|nr:NUDIX domain-containing protein [bacterium]